MRSIEQKAGTTLIEELNREQPRVSVDGDVDADESWINFAFVCYAANTTRLNRTTTEQLQRCIRVVTTPSSRTLDER